LGPLHIPIPVLSSGARRRPVPGAERPFNLAANLDRVAGRRSHPRVIRGHLQNLSVDTTGRMFLSEPNQPPLNLQVLAVRKSDNVGTRIEPLSSLAHAAPPSW